MRGGERCSVPLTSLHFDRGRHEDRRLGVLVVGRAIERHSEVMLDDGRQAGRVQGLDRYGCGWVGGWRVVQMDVSVVE